VISPFWGAIAAVVAAALIWKQHYRDLIRQPLNQGWIALAIGLIFTTAFAVNRGNALLGLFHFLPYITVFIALKHLLQTPQQLRQIAWILCLSSLPAVMIGFGQRFWHWTGPIHFGLVLNWSLEATGNPAGRMSSVFDYANVFASYLVIIFGLALGLWIDIWQKNVQIKSVAKLTTGRSLGLQLLLLSLIGVGSGAALVLTDSRNAWAIAVLAGLAYAVYVGWTWLLAGVSFIAACVLGAAFGPNPIQGWLRQIVPAFFWARLTDQLYPDRPVEQLRSTQWEFAWSLAQQRPWTGWGLRNFSALYQAKAQLWLGHPHNLFLMLASEAGIVVTLTLIGLVGTILWQGVRWIRLSVDQPSNQLLLFSYLVAFMATTSFHLLDVTLFDLRINLLGWLLLAGICGVAEQKPDPHPSSFR
jgi:O-antigen ligase